MMHCDYGPIKPEEQKNQRSLVCLAKCSEQHHPSDIEIYEKMIPEFEAKLR